MDRPAWTHQTDVPYIFAIYAREDADPVHQEMAWLHEQEFNVRCDVDIHADDAWSPGLADSIQQAALVLCFVSSQSASSSGFRELIENAAANNPLLLDVHLGRPQSGAPQASMETAPILKYDLTDDEYRARLISELLALAPDTRIQPISTPAMPIMDEKGAPNLLQHGLIAAIILALGILTYLFMVP